MPTIVPPTKFLVKTGNIVGRRSSNHLPECALAGGAGFGGGQSALWPVVRSGCPADLELMAAICPIWVAITSRSAGDGARMLPRCAENARIQGRVWHVPLRASGSLVVHPFGGATSREAMTRP